MGAILLQTKPCFSKFLWIKSWIDHWELKSIEVVVYALREILVLDGEMKLPLLKVNNCLTPRLYILKNCPSKEHLAWCYLQIISNDMEIY